MAAETVIVGCKAPNGLILNLDTYEVIDQRNFAVRKIEGRQTVTLRGYAHKFNEPDHTLPTGGYRLNQVPADFWAEWIKRNENSPLIKDKIILPPPSAGANQQASGTAQARDMGAIPRMNPPLNPEGDQRGGYVKPLERTDK